jgi:hypothetical protein
MAERKRKADAPLNRRLLEQDRVGDDDDVHQVVCGFYRFFKDLTKFLYFAGLVGGPLWAPPATNSCAACRCAGSRLYWSSCLFLIFLSCRIMELPKAQFPISASDRTTLSECSTSIARQQTRTWRRRVQWRPRKIFAGAGIHGSRILSFF